MTRLVSALPLVILGETRQHGDYGYTPGRRWPDTLIAEDFQRLHRDDYLHVFALARWMGVGFALLGGWIVFRWARELFGDGSGLLALSLWTFCPFVLAHAGLVTPDVGATSLMIAASYAFWRNLRSPSLEWCVGSGVLLGLAEAAKFTAVVLPGVWIVLATARFVRRDHVWGPRPRFLRLLGHATLLTAVSLATLNTVYVWEGTGQRLGDFALRSPSLTMPAANEEGDAPRRVNRFAGTWAHSLPVPLPEHYVLGFDDQLWDLEAGKFHKYLGGDLRGPDEEGWWYYYLYGLLVKLPLGALALIGGAAVVWLASYRRRLQAAEVGAAQRLPCELVTELALLLPPLAIIGSLSLKTGLNSHVRYVLPALPLLFVFAGRIAPWCAAGRRWRAALVIAAVVVNAASVLRVHPHYLAYFNEMAGGPRGGIRHLADSNLDWGQGLVPLREWLDEHAPGQTIQLAYFGMMHPENAGIDYEWLDPQNPKPGLHAVSATLLVGIPRFVSTDRGRMAWNDDAFREYRRLTPIATPGYSIYVFDVSEEIAVRLRDESER